MLLTATSLLVSRASGPDFAPGMWVVLRPNPAKLRELLHLRDIFHVVNGVKEARLYAVEFWHELPVVFSRLFEDTEPGEISEWVEVPGPLRRRPGTEEEEEHPRVEMMTVHALEHGLQWQWALRHTDGWFFSAVLPWSVLEEVAGAGAVR